ncbi:hypothetical protein BYT27DRAFT_7339743 [Phlegmacium glaucopus]|nr:hypothetical protein BYT27DRAFT_7339743 [Phlegmacium glaucopus]
MSFIPTVATLQPPKDKYQILKEDFCQLQHDLKKINMHLEGYKQELRRTRMELRNAAHYANELHHEKQGWKDQINGLQNESNNVHLQIDDAERLSEVLEGDLSYALNFLTRADTLSISEVGERVTALNEEIFQAAATLGEALIHQRHELPLEDWNAAAAESQQMVGSTISNILITQAQKPEPEVNPLLVQVVLQIFMVKFCVSKIQSWYPSDVNIEEFLDAIYSEIRSSEEQAVSGRWRALTRAHITPTTDTWTNELFEKLISVLKIASWMPGSPDDQESFTHHLPPIFKAVSELRIAIGENFTSADLDACTHDCGTVYVPLYMEAAYGDSRQQQSDDKRPPKIVAGTTGIGLKKLMAERGANDTLQFQNVISAKIVLESTLKEAVEPVQTSGKPDLPDAPPVIINTATTTTKQRSPQSPIDRSDERSGVNTHMETTSDTDSSTSLAEIYDDLGAPSDNLKEGGERSSYPKGPPTTSTAGGKLIRVGLTQASAQAQAHPAIYAQAIGGRPPNVQVVPGHLPEEEQQEMVEHRQPNQGGNYGQRVMETIKSFMPTAVASPQPPKDKYQILKEDFRQLKYDLKRTNIQLEGCKQDLRRTRMELRNASHYANELHRKKQRWKDHMNGLQNELNNIHQQLDDAKNLCKVRGKELHGAQVFLTKADALSISEVGEKVTALNEEIFQAAATLGEALIHQRHELPPEDLDAAAAESQHIVGNTISNILISQAQRPEPVMNPLLVQVVLQIFMVNFCVSKIQSWYPSDVNIEAFLDAIYSEIRSSEEQAVSGRWRALTRAHTRPTTDTWTTELSEKLMSILRIASWMPGSPDDQESFTHRLPPIFKAVNELRIAIGEKFTSADLDVCTFHCGTRYAPSYMEDAYGDSRQQQSDDKRPPEIVAGTTSIGLKKLMAERGANDALQFQNVISAKIVLESTLKEALEPVPTRRLRKTKRWIK